MICCPLKQENKPVDTSNIRRPRFQGFGGHQIQDLGFVHQTLKRLSDKDLLSQLWVKGITHNKSDVLGRYLVCYPNQLVARELHKGFTEGFRLQYTCPRFSVCSSNLASASQFKNETLNKLENEIQQGRILGPFLLKPISTLRISPMGLVPKPDGGGV